MRRLWRLSKGIFACLIFGILVYTLIHANLDLHFHDSIIINKSPEELWNFVAELQHKRLTDQSLSNIEIVDESGGGFSSWKYNAILTEKIDLIGTIKVMANYEIKPAINGTFLINTNMYWCKFAYNCAYANNILTFSKQRDSPATIIEEVVNVKAPKLLLWMTGSQILLNSFSHKLHHIKRHFNYSH